MAIELINRLMNELNNSDVVYCHWKSNYSLTESFSGNMDLDLIVDRSDLSNALIILANLGFKQATIRFGMMPSGIFHYYGFDFQTGQLIHIHLFNRILTGESFVKSHQFPFEMMLLKGAYRIGQMNVTSKPAELVLFILRTFIKYGSLLDLMYLISKSEDIKAELHWLMADNDISESLSLLKTYCPVVDKELFLTCIEVLKSKGLLFKRVVLAQRVRRRLHIYAIDNPLKRAFTYIQLLWEQGIRHLNGNKKNKMPSAGGMVIAFVGPEATGKSTLVSESKKWLSQAFAVNSVHAGKPRSSWITAPINMTLPVTRQLWPRFRTSRLEGHVSDSDREKTLPKLTGWSGIIYALRSVSLAWDRRQLLIRARRLAASGEIVICDRYPSETIGAMDSPRLQENRSTGGLLGIILNSLAHLENRLYLEIPPPDIVLKLKVSVETAKKRNQERIKIGKETDEYLGSRHRQSQEWNKSGTKHIYEIDTEQSLAETISCVRNAIWESI
jgi:thymidylate kinase